MDAGPVREPLCGVEREALPRASAALARQALELQLGQDEAAGGGPGAAAAPAVREARGFVYLKLGDAALAFREYDNALRANGNRPLALYGPGPSAGAQWRSKGEEDKHAARCAHAMHRPHVRSLWFELTVVAISNKRCTRRERRRCQIALWTPDGKGGETRPSTADRETAHCCSRLTVWTISRLTNPSFSTDGRISGPALGGPLYVLRRGFPKQAAIMFPISVVLAVTAAGLVIAVTGLVNQTMVNVIAGHRHPGGDAGGAIDHRHPAHAGSLHPARMARRLLGRQSRCKAMAE